MAGEWDEILNTDASEFGGSGVGNFGVVHATDEPWAGRPASAELTLPPLAGLSGSAYASAAALRGGYREICVACAAGLALAGALAVLTPARRWPRRPG